jgi:hypothetical protein
MKRSGPSMEPWATPMEMEAVLELALLQQVTYLLERNDSNQSRATLSRPMLESFRTRIEHLTLFYHNAMGASALTFHIITWTSFSSSSLCEVWSKE